MATIKVQAQIKHSLQDTWDLFTDPMHVIKWNAASPDWHTTFGESDLKNGGKYAYRMEAKDGSVGFDFGGTYTHVVPQKQLDSTLGDGRKLKISFSGDAKSTKIVEEFDPEKENTPEMQKSGWQAILDNFKKYAESRGPFELLKFSTSIQALVTDVYEKMLDEKTYREWTKAFNAESQYVGSWKKGSMIRFIGVDEKGQRGGMVSRVKENMPSKFLSIEHLGIIQGDKEIMSGQGVEEWAGALENYKFIADGKKTLVEVSMDANQEFKSYFSETWPKALELLKKICEKK